MAAEPGHLLPAAARRDGGLGAPVPASLVLFSASMGVALGYCLGLLLH